MCARPHASCRGSLPSALSGLEQLRWLLLSGNELQGPLPAFLGGLPGLQVARLQGNNFSGPVPDEWCASSAAFDVKGNRLLCGELLCSCWLPGGAAQLACTPRACPLSHLAHTVRVLKNGRRLPHACPARLPAFASGTVPSCLALPGRLGSIDGTFLSLATLGPMSGSTSSAGACDATAPDCDPDVGCV